MRDLQSKSYTVTQSLSRYFLSVDINDRIKTISDFTMTLDVARGTIQNSIQTLKDSNAIELKARGALGTYLVAKDMKLLLRFANINYLIGTMPLPYSKLYEGLSTGIIEVMQERLDMSVNLAYMRGAQKRIDMVAEGRYDFAVVSKYAANYFLKNNDESIQIVSDFGPQSFLMGHALILKDPKKLKIENGMRIGIDEASIDQSQLTLIATQNIDVKLIPLSYSQFLNSLDSGDIDGVIWNIDELEDKLDKYNVVNINNDNLDNTTAVLVANKNRREIIKLLEKSINIDSILNIQKEVVSGRLTPSY